MAAYYCGLSPNTFDDRVKAGQFPQPHQDGRRMVWDLRELDKALDGDAVHHLDGMASAESQSQRDIAAAEAMALAAIQQSR
ncbi:conserved protein of unknown function (Bacteriophage P4, Orf88 6-40) [Magnetospirillum sp. XM-1]|uniref:helix-turn-helix transcriptional regulator n=1 Tax=Magnetospirillum sp. XM-1 TaxID=1663591 RepID=UPI00073DC4C1|nr:hypothetical protein [Magnetospirillum sp. XM-1]CUW41671.1 conserved protein of unknown function (Bacteriophage P4, Orf88 6-40) [Magnetospirillum sp. XM-1]